MIIQNEPLVIFLAEVVKEKKHFKEELLKLVFKSKDLEEKNCNGIYAAANAITVLIASNMSFANMDLSHIKVCGANLREGCFNGCDFTDADLSEVILENCSLNQTIFKKTKMKNVKLGVFPEIYVQ